MRLICPNCGAQYDVDEGVIPETGRDVQCSNCGNTWWQTREDLKPPEEQPAVSEDAAETVEEASASESVAETEAVSAEAETSTADDQQTGEAVAEAETSEPEEKAVAETTEAETAEAVAAQGEEETQAPEPEVMKVTAGEDTPPSSDPDATVDSLPAADERAEETSAADEASKGEAGEEDTPEPVLSHGEDDPPLVSTPVPPPGFAKRSLDEEVLNVLRQEAEREAAQRETEEEGDQKPDSETADADSHEAAVRERMELAKALDDTGTEDEAVDEGTGASTGRVISRLPDIDEINSTLESRTAAAASSEAAPNNAESRRFGFRIGFTLMMLVVAGIVLTYHYSQELATAMPGMSENILAFAESVDGFRVWLDQAAIDATEAIQGISGEEEG